MRPYMRQAGIKKHNTIHDPFGILADDLATRARCRAAQPE